MEGKSVVPTAIEKWNSTYDICSEDWPEIFRLPYSCTTDTQLQSFQYKILHRIFPCNKWLNIQKVIPSAQCQFCNELDDIEHYLCNCCHIVDFWTELEKWWNLHFFNKVKITPNIYCLDCIMMCHISITLTLLYC